MVKKSKDPIVATLSGSIAGAIEAIATWPTEFIKTQLQLQAKSKASTSGYKYKNSFDCARYTVKNEGILGLYRGLSPVLIGSMPKAAIRFGGYTYFSNALKNEQGKLSSMRTLAAGLMAGASEAILIVTPMETLKVRLIDGNKGLLKGTMDIVRAEGLGGIYKGVTPTVLKQSSNQGIRFMSYGEIMKLIKGNDPDRDAKPWESLIGGMSAGCLSVIGNNPIDVIKTRMQGIDANKYKSTMDCFLKTLTNDGPLGFYKGALPRMGRVLPGQGLIFMSFETIQSFISNSLDRKQIIQ
jgi:solute carrier family 25 citrate transporter 1